VAVILAIVVGYAGWKFYTDRQTLKASAGLDEAMKTYNRAYWTRGFLGRIRRRFLPD